MTIIIYKIILHYSIYNTCVSHELLIQNKMLYRLKQQNYCLIWIVTLFGNYFKENIKGLLVEMIQ